LERAGVLGGLGAYGGDDDEDEPEPVDAKDYYRSSARTAASASGDGETHYHSGGGGAAASGGAYGRELGGKAEALESSEDEGSDASERSPAAGETDAERVARIQREKLRIERRKERERQMRLENMKV